MTGFININKASGVSSAREVAIIKRLTGMPCGHMGTLDPMASGVLPIGIGNACRLFDYFLDKRKRYVATFRFGEDSDTLDTTGTILSSGGYVPTESQIEGVLGEFIGDILQIPPKYSAKNVDGKRGYQLAREGKDFVLPPKKVSIYSLKSKRVSEIEYQIEIECGGGTYVRSIGRDIAEKLSTKAIMSSLIRTQSGAFVIENSVQSEKINKDNISDYIIQTESLLPFDSIYPTGNDEKKLFNGLSVQSELADGIYKIFKQECFYGLAEVNNSILRIKTKLC